MDSQLNKLMWEREPTYCFLPPQNAHLEEGHLSSSQQRENRISRCDISHRSTDNVKLHSDTMSVTISWSDLGATLYELAENTRDFSHEMNRLRTREGFSLLASPTGWYNIFVQIAH